MAKGDVHGEWGGMHGEDGVWQRGACMVSVAKGGMCGEG